MKEVLPFRRAGRIGFANGRGLASAEGARPPRSPTVGRGSRVSPGSASQERSPAGDAISFLSYRLDRRAALLFCDGRAIPLRPKTWDVLVYLAQRPGVLVARDELLDAVWPDVAVTPSTLTKSISELREALDDDPKQPRCIETVHRRGFRFIARTDGPSGDAPALAVAEMTAGGGFVGRGPELRQLEMMLARAGGGDRQIAFVTGEAGIGKTALVEAFLRSLEGRAATLPVWIGRGLSIEQQGAREAYRPFLDAIEALARRQDATQFRALLRRIAPNWFAQIPWLLADDPAASQQAALNYRPERMLRELAALVEAATAEVTMVVVLEDLHWADPSTIDLLSFLGERTQRARLLLLCTFRPAEISAPAERLSAVVPALKGHGRCVELRLGELSRSDLEQYIEGRFPGADFCVELAARIHSYTEGNPLFVVSVIQHNLQRGWIVETDPGWALAMPLDRWRLEIPEDTKQSIEMALRRLSPPDRELLRAASLVGVEFTARSVASPLRRSIDDVESRCDELVRSGWFLRESGVTEWADGSVGRCYAFVHDLYRQVLYAGIPVGRRQQLHQGVGESLEAAHGERGDEIAGALALHFAASGDHPRAVRYLSAAGFQALRRLAHREAESCFVEALRHAGRLPDKTERLRQELAIRLAIMPSLNEIHGGASDAVCRNGERALAICDGVGGREQLFHILASLAHMYWNRGDADRGPAALARLNVLSTQLGGPEYLLWANSMSVRGAFHSGTFVEACRLAEETLPAVHEAVDATLAFAHGPQPLIAAHYHVALSAWMLGEVPRAREVMQSSLAAAWESGLPVTLIGASCVASLLEVLCRDPLAAGRLADQALAMSVQLGEGFWSSLALAVKGWTLVQAGQLREATNALARARAAYRSNLLRLTLSYCLAFEAEAYLRLGEIDAGLAVIDEGLGLAETTLERSYRPELWRLKGELLLAAARTQRGPAAPLHWREAEGCLRRAIESARSTQAKSLELRAATSLARAMESRGRYTEARELLAGVCGWFPPDVESVDLAEARSLLAALAPPRRGKAGSRTARR